MSESPSTQEPEEQGSAAVPAALGLLLAFGMLLTMIFLGVQCWGGCGAQATPSILMLGTLSVGCWFAIYSSVAEFKTGTQAGNIAAFLMLVPSAIMAAIASFMVLLGIFAALKSLF
ncbi:MAG: hypothetical protein V4593_14960 [Pseudomonadota bacterium]|jgi:hypothetical protein